MYTFKNYIIDYIWGYYDVIKLIPKIFTYQKLIMASILNLVLVSELFNRPVTKNYELAQAIFDSRMLKNFWRSP